MKPKPVVNLQEPSHLRLRIDFWKLAYWAIGEGLLTKGEADMIARVGHRKEIYWARHLKDLVEIIQERESKNENSPAIR